MVPGSVWIPLPSLRERMAELDRTRTVLVMCQGGYRSSIATSMLQAAGFPSVENVVGGFDAWSIAFPEVAQAPACASTT
jgi:rhodanese-related sulfurtransferase